VEGESVAKVEEVRLCPVFSIRFLLLLVSVCVVLRFKRVSVKSVPFCVAFVRRVSEPGVPRMSEDA
jgi:hypothetical protein